MTKSMPVFAARAFEVAKRPDIARLNIPDISYYEQLDDAHLLALVETLRPIIYAHMSVLINRAIPMLPKSVPDYPTGLIDSMDGLKNDLSVTAANTISVAGSDRSLQELVYITDDMLEVLRYARLRHLYDPIEPGTITPGTIELATRGAGTGIRLGIATIDYIYKMIRSGHLDIDPYNLSSDQQARDILVSLSTSIARRVGLQDLGPLMRILQGADDPFEKSRNIYMNYLPTDVNAPHFTKLKSLIDEVRIKRAVKNSDQGYDPYILEKLMCPAVVGMDGINPISDLVDWVVGMADFHSAYDLRELAS